jgi:small conductance mechanosensitive channel
VDITNIGNFLIQEGIQIGIKIIGAIIVYLVGKWLIGFVVNLLSKSLNSQKVDLTIIRYLSNIVSVIANIALVIAILGYFGVETTSFAALFAAAGIAIGAAWSGLLANFAAGAFIIVLAPYKVGDFITAGGVTGTVREIGLFATTIEAPDHVLNFVGNNKMFADNIQNFSRNEYRRVDLTAQLNGSVDHRDAMARLKEGMSKIPNVLAEPAPDVEILEFNFAGPVLAVRPYTNNANYWQVYFDTNKLIKESFGAAGYPAPAPQYAIRNVG